MLLTLSLVALLMAFTCGVVMFHRTPATIAVGSTEHYLLAKNSLRRSAIVSLLLSSSFGVNALLYAAWLGYSVGVWGFVVQLAWAVSFFLLSKYAGRIGATRSLHELLGERFGSATKVIASVCTLIGFIYLMGWEFKIGAVTTGALLSEINGPTPDAFTISVMVGVVGTVLLYTLWSGMSGNAAADRFLNLVKLVCLFSLSAVLLSQMSQANMSGMTNAVFPTWETMRDNLGIWGLMTNIVFNLAWQFVDNSSWQSLIAGYADNDQDAAKTLRVSGLVIFLTIGFLGTVFGIALAGTAGVTPDNILVKATKIISSPFAIVAALLLVVACVMSLLDGMLLSATFTFLLDLLHQRTPLERVSLGSARLVLVVMAFISTYGVNLIFDASGLSLFDFVYVVIITQLALIGPVLVALSTKLRSLSMYMPVLLALIAGFAAVVVGTGLKISYLVDGAGTITVLVSVASAILMTLISRGSNRGTEERHYSEDSGP